MFNIINSYVYNFKNTFATDVLEGLNLIIIRENINEKDEDLGVMKQNSRVRSGYDETITEKGNSDPFLVEFKGAKDTDHPRNWSILKKGIIVFEIMLLTCVNYMGSSIYTPGQVQIQRELGVGHVVGTLNLSLYVLGYGLGPIIFSPLSEFAIFGRQQLYVITFFLFSMLQIGCALVRNIAGLVILRFFTGVLCSPPLATGAATITDVIKPELVPIFIGLWAVGAVAAPVIGPLLGAVMVVAEDWRWIFWLLMWMSASLLIGLVLFFPETSEDNILYRRCLRIRKITGDHRYYTLKADQESKLTAKDIAIMALYRPFEIIIKDPVVLALDSYIAVCYGAFYLFFEAFPIVFVGVYHFTLIELGLAFLGFCVGCGFAYAITLIFLSLYIRRKLERGDLKPEAFLVLSMGVGWCLPISLFLFGWAASVHWTLPMVAEIIFVIAVFNIFQSVFAYLSMSYPKYAASVFAGNDTMRSGFACAFPLFGQAMYNNLSFTGFPVGWGSSIVGFICIGLAIIPFILYRYSPYLRAKSKFANF